MTGLKSFAQRCQEQTAELLSYPEHTTAHHLGTLPVYNTGINLTGKLLRFITADPEVIIAPTQYQYAHGTWVCITIASHNDTIPVGGHPLVLLRHQIQRCPEVTLTWDDTGQLIVTEQTQPIWTPNTTNVS